MAQPPTSGSLRVDHVPGRLRAALLLSLVLTTVAVACAGGAPVEPRPEASATTVPPIRAPAVLPDTRSVALAGVAGATPAAEPIKVRGGEADLVGVVAGPDGPVRGAKVLLERFVADQRAELVVRTDRQGRFRALGVFGGRYRIRGWRAPDLAVTVPELRFVRDDDKTEVDLAMSLHDGLDVQAVVSDRSPVVGGSVTVTALVTRRTVDDNGIVSAPSADGERVRLVPSSTWDPADPPPLTVDGDGRVSWASTCARAGSGAFQVLVGDGVSTTITTDCRAPEPDPVDPVGDPPPTTDFPVGNRFTPPNPTPLPAGTYDVVEGPGTCGITFERYVDGAWETSRRTATDSTGFSVSTPIRDVRLIGDSSPCTYERVA